MVASLVVAVAVAFAAGVAVGERGDDADDQFARTARMMRADTMTQMMRSGSFQEMVHDHEAMMDRLRSGMTLEMREAMDDDEMWQMMHRGRLEMMMREHADMLDDLSGMHDADTMR